MVVWRSCSTGFLLVGGGSNRCSQGTLPDGPAWAPAG
jgi:hypothetical protein